MIKEERKFDIEDRLIDFAVMIAEIVETLPNTKAANHIKNVWNFLLSFQKVLKLPERISKVFSVKRARILILNEPLYTRTVRTVV